MKHCWMLLTRACVLSIPWRNACGQATPQKSFDTKLYAIEAIGHFGTDDGKYAALTDLQKQSLLEARNDLMNMLQAVEHGRDVTKYVSQEMARKYPTSTALAASIIEPETSVLAAVSDFDVIDKSAVRLKFFAVLVPRAK